MQKVWAVAVREYKAAVHTKAFVVSLLMMPILMGGSIALQLLLRRVDNRTTKAFAVVDRTGKLDAALLAALKQYNEVESIDTATGDRDSPEYSLTFVEPSPTDEAAMQKQRYDLSERVRAGEFEGFLEIGPDVFEAAPPNVEDGRAARFQSEKTEAGEFRRWAWRAVNNAVQERRFADKGVSQDLVRRIQAPVTIVVKGLTKRDAATGAIQEASNENRVVNIVLPGMLLALMFMMVMLGSMPAMQGVVEEKQQRIAEVLLGSVSPFELMLGKLLGVVAVSLTVSAVYLGGGYAALARYGMTASLSGQLIGWFLVFLVLAVLMYGSLFMAVGAAAGDIKETQTLSMPIMMLVTLPMLMLGPVLRDPGGTVAVVGSFVPFATPMLMVARVASPAGVAWWQPAIGAAMVLVASMACVWAAGRIFRVGLLMQGKGVKFADLARWVVSG
ncbi:MAG: ABC transporter permease [Gemmataceae bacterium]